MGGVWMWFGMAPGGWVALLLYVVRDSGGWGEENRVCVWRFLPLDRSGFTLSGWDPFVTARLL